MKRIIISSIICFLIATSLSAVSLKQSDGFLNEGLSIKALSSGGSYVGIRDNLASAVYNPAVLGSMNYRALSGAYSENSEFRMNKFLLGYNDLLDYNIHYGVILLREGMGSIDAYDSSGLKTGQVLENTKTIGIFGLGRNIIYRLTGGVSLKVLQQDLAGFSDTGAGLDLGLYWNRSTGVKHSVIDYILNNLEAGFAFKNILGPNMKFKITEEKEPYQIRGGIGYTFDLINRFISGSHLLLLSEAMYTEGQDNMDLSFGMEIKLFEQIRIRGGYGLSMMRAGLGVDLDEFGFDYGYMNSGELANTHSIGITMKLKRLNAKREEKEVFQKTSRGLEARLNTEYVFRYNSDVMKSAGYRILNSLINEVKNNDDYKVKIEGYFSNIGSAEFNLDLFVKQAFKVYEYFIKNGIERGRVIFEGLGKSNFLASNDVAVSGPKKRRIDIILFTD
ncbi:MAG: OmpA family protein [Spirochaetes bacterium]|nr:OmpA family protein [Spirochaetota bacterium]